MLGDMELKTEYTAQKEAAPIARNTVWVATYRDSYGDYTTRIFATQALCRDWRKRIAERNWDSDWNEVDHVDDCAQDGDCDCEAVPPDDIEDEYWSNHADDESFEWGQREIETSL